LAATRILDKIKEEIGPAAVQRSANSRRPLLLTCEEVDDGDSWPGLGGYDAREARQMLHLGTGFNCHVKMVNPPRIGQIR